MQTIEIEPHAPGQGWWVLTDHIRYLGRLPGRDVDLIEVQVAPGSGTPPHTHASAELFHVTEGEVTLGRFGAGPPAFRVLHAGEAAAVEPDAPHNYMNNSDHPARMVVLVEPQMTAFFRDLGRKDPPPAGPPGADLLAEVHAACARHGIRILSP
jgi:quercetin dioxygenase-like cupin family protein